MAILYASQTGSNTAPYDTLAKGATSISTALNAAHDGDTVRIDSGTWNIAGRLNMDGDVAKIALVEAVIPGLCTIAGNGVNDYGGFLFLADSITDWDIEFSGIAFSLCRAPNGGAIFITSNAHVRMLTVTNCSFNTCTTSTGWGGAIYFNSAHASKSLVIDTSTFTSCASTLYGGAVYSASFVTLKGQCEFNNNTCIGTGGGITCSGILDTDGSIFSGNMATTQHGGVSSSTGSINLNGSRFSDNDAGAGAGGGIGANTGTTVVMNDVIFERNYAFRGGGFYSQVSATLNRVEFVNNVCDVGGAVGGCSGGGSLLYGAGVIGIYNDCVWDGNRAKWGGGAYDSQGAQSTFNRPVFKNNIADGSLVTVPDDAGEGGGAAYHAGGASVITAKINDGILYNNTSSAINGGGAIHILNNNTVEANRCVFYNNRIIDGGTGSAVAHGASSAVFKARNSILWDNGGSHGVQDIAASDIDYCDLQGALGSNVTDGGHNIYSDPKFVDAANNKLYLRYDSPCIGTGIDLGDGFTSGPDKLSVWPDAVLLYNPGERRDIGAYPYRSAGHSF